jgi:hypothetical protein
MATFDVTDEPVFGIGVESSAVTFDASDFGYDFAIGGRAFLNAISKQTPYRRGLAEIRKQQYDTSTNPGEQSLDGYWLRSQQDFTGGAGITFMEPSNDEFQMKRFASSLGVDPWTRGKLTLLKSAVSTRTLTSNISTAVAVNNGSNKYIVTAESANGTVYYDGYAAGTVNSWTGTPNGNATSTGDGVVVCTTSGMQYLAAPFTGSKVLLASHATTTTMNAWWVKQRFIIADGHHLIEKGGIDSSVNLGSTPKLYSHPLGTWTWTSVVETPNAILAAGYAGSKSAIYKFTLNPTDGTLPDLTSAITAAELPYGELVTGMFAYLGSYVIIGTNRGVRVGQVDGNGDLAYGPLSFTSTSTTTISGMAGRDRFVYVGVGNELDGNSGLIRIDLGSTDGEGRYAWATDLNSGTTGSVRSVTNYGDLIAFTQTNLYIESSTDYVTSGYLTTGQVRYNTLEPKNFRYFRLRGKTNTGTVNVSSVLYNQDPQSLFTFSDAVNINQDITIAIPTNPQQESLGLKITLNRGAIVDGEYPTPTVTGWQLKAVPGSNRRILVKIPLLCFDHETDNAGTARGREGYAYDRLVDLQSYCTNGAVVVFQDLRTGEQFSATIEDVSFTQEVANTQNKVDNFGGIIEVTVQQV